jgi:hypothetical protein
MLAYDRQVANAQRVILQKILLFFRECEQRFALRGGQEFTTRHETILTMNKAFENRDRSGFRDSMICLSFDEDANLPPRIHGECNDSAPDSLRFTIQVLSR